MTDQIITTLSTYLNVSPDVFTNGCRLRKSVEARQLAMYFIKNRAGLNHRAIGFHLGGRIKGTVTHGIKQVSGLIQVDKGYRERVSDIEALLNQ